MRRYPDSVLCLIFTIPFAVHAFYGLSYFESLMGVLESD
jgi:hypothetical protein